MALQRADTNRRVKNLFFTLISILERLRDRATQISNIAYHEQVRAPSVLFVTLQHNIANVNKFTCAKISYQADFSHYPPCQSSLLRWHTMRNLYTVCSIAIISFAINRNSIVFFTPICTPLLQTIFHSKFRKIKFCDFVRLTEKIVSASHTPGPFKVLLNYRNIYWHFILYII